MTFTRTRIGILALVTSCALAGVWASTPVPDAPPTCDYPQALAPYQYSGSPVAGRMSAAWNGREYGTAYCDGNSSIYFRRFYADGTPAAPQVYVGNTVWTGSSLPVSILWNGTQYAVAWGGASSGRPYLAILDANGTLLYGPTAASTGTSVTLETALASSGSGYLLTWRDNRSGNYDIYGTLFNADATIANAGASHDLVICNAASAQIAPWAAWSRNGYYVVVWSDFRSAAKYEIYADNIYPNGGMSGNYSVVSGAGSSNNPTLMSAGGGFGMAWYDNRDGNNEIYFARLDGSGQKIGSDVRLTNNSTGSTYPFIAWTGGEYGVFWLDTAGGTSDVWFQRVSVGGAAQGSAVQLLSGINLNGPPAASFAKHGYLASSAITWVSGYVQAFGCSYAAPPPCPENALAYNISGTQATIAWLPAVDPYFDIAYYQVYRNNALVGITSSDFYTDTGLSLNTTYNYSIRTVNAGQWASTGCPAGASTYVKTNASLVLMVNKSQPDALLTWTDGALTHYNVFRGTSPQVMQQVGNTTGQLYQDPGVLNDAVLYFYTVDDPGQ